MLYDIDCDTQGLVVVLDIGDSIYKKINRADLFIVDVKIINQDYTGRKTLNPNVLIERGYTIRVLLGYHKSGNSESG